MILLTIIVVVVEIVMLAIFAAGLFDASRGWSTDTPRVRFSKVASLTIIATVIILLNILLGLAWR